MIPTFPKGAIFAGRLLEHIRVLPVPLYGSPPRKKSSNSKKREVTKAFTVLVATTVVSETSNFAHVGNLSGMAAALGRLTEIFPGKLAATRAVCSKIHE